MNTLLDEIFCRRKPMTFLKQYGSAELDFRSLFFALLFVSWQGSPKLDIDDGETWLPIKLPAITKELGQKIT